MTTLPKRFAQYAAALAEANPIAFKDAADCEASMARSYRRIKTSANTTGVTTGGYYFTKDADGDIEMWVSPDVVLGGKYARRS